MAMDRKTGSQDVTWFIDLWKQGKLDLDPPYQRRSVWTKRDQQFYIDTILNNYPCPPIFLHKEVDEDGVSVYHVVDGKQRLQTIISFVNGDIAIGADFGESDIAGKRWKDLQTETRKRVWNYSITVEMLPVIEDSIVKNVFDRINRNSRKLSRQELRHAKFDGWFIEAAEAETDQQFWKDFKIVTTARARRMSDVQFVSEVMGMTIYEDVFGFNQDWLDQLYADFENYEYSKPEFNPDQFLNDFASVKAVLVNMNKHNGVVEKNVKTLAGFYSLWAYVLLDRTEQITDESIAEKYEQFLQIVLDPNAAPNDEIKEQAELYAAASTGATTDAAPRNTRRSALASYINAN